ncbi:hypothetical protein SH501x_004761 [Pirellulaceae bacterium SH501]
MLFFFWLLWIGFAVLCASTARGNDGQGVVIRSIYSGLNGVWKVGFETVHRIELISEVDSSLALELDTVDGDGVGVRYRSAEWTVHLKASEPSTFSLYAKHGRANRPIVVRLLDGRTGEVLREHPLTDVERGEVLPAEQPWVVGIGSSGMKLDSAILRSAKGLLGDYTVTEIDDSQSIPEKSSVWDGVDLMIFSSSNAKLLGELTDSQAAGVRDWIRSGGRCLLSLGAHSEAWFQHASLSSLVPGRFVEVAKQCNPGPLESYLNSEIPLQPFDSAVLELNDATLELIGQKGDRAKYPLIAKWAFGLGKVRFIATELDSESLLRWESQPAFIKWILNDQWEGRGANSKAMVGAEDLSLQLNSTLDQFIDLKMGSLTQMSLLLGFLLAILGPIDYFLVAKRWRKPRWTWATLIATSVGCCLFLAGLQKSWKPASAQLNAVELVDIDASTGTLVARSYAHLYGGSRGVFAVRAMEKSDGLLGSQSRDMATAAQHLAIDWMGHPGKSLGGFDSTVATDRILPGYEIVRRGDATAEAGRDGSQSDKLQFASVQELVRTAVERLGVPEAGTKSLMASGEVEIPASWNFGQLSSVPGAIDLLNGSIVNPLPCDLRNGVLLYRGRFYSLPLRMRTGEGVSISVSTIPKDFARRLQKRINVDGKDEGTPWNKQETGDPKRLLEMIAFHRSGGGFGYTGLIHRYLSRLDMSELLRSERAILFAELSESQVEWVATRRDLQETQETNDEPSSELAGSRTSMIRIVIPVMKPSEGGTGRRREDE